MMGCRRCDLSTTWCRQRPGGCSHCLRSVVVGEMVCQILCRSYLCYNHMPTCHNLFNEMILAFNVLHFLVVYRFIGLYNCAPLWSQNNVIGDYFTLTRSIKNFMSQIVYFAASQATTYLAPWWIQEYKIA
jgi:hypothetical protein